MTIQPEQGQGNLAAARLASHFWVRLSWLAAATGLGGAFLIGLNVEASKFGFLAWVISNASWMAVGIATRQKALVLMNVGYMGTTLLGIWKWF